MMCTNSLRDSKVNHCARLSAYRSSVLLVNVNEPGRRCVRPACVCLYVCVNVNNLDFCERKYDFEKQNTF